METRQRQTSREEVLPGLARNERLLSGRTFSYAERIHIPDSIVSPEFQGKMAAAKAAFRKFAKGRGAEEIADLNSINNIEFRMPLGSTAASIEARIGIAICVRSSKPGDTYGEIFLQTPGSQSSQVASTIRQLNQLARALEKTFRTT